MITFGFVLLFCSLGVAIGFALACDVYRKRLRFVEESRDFWLVRYRLSDEQRARLLHYIITSTGSVDTECEGPASLPN